jgi:hypothetical protein
MVENMMGVDEFLSQCENNSTLNDNNDNDEVNADDGTDVSVGAGKKSLASDDTKQIPYDQYLVMKCLVAGSKKYQDGVETFLEKCSLSELIYFYDRTKVSCGDSDYDKFSPVINLTIKELTKRWMDIKEEHISKYSFDLIKDFLETKDYSHSNATPQQMLDLEVSLAGMIYHFCKKDDQYGRNDMFESKKNEVIENVGTLLNLIHYESISFNVIDRLYSLDQVQDLIDTSSDLANKFMENACSTLVNKKPIKPSRFKKYDESIQNL